MEEGSVELDPLSSSDDSHSSEHQDHDPKTPSEPPPLVTDNEPAVDTCNFAYLTCLLLGTTSLLPWNSMITSVDYFGTLFEGVESDIAVPYTVASFFTSAAISGCGGTRLPVPVRIYASMAGFLALLMVIPTALYFNQLHRWLIVTASSCIGFCDAWIQSGIFGFASFLSPVHIKGHQLGHLRPRYHIFAHRYQNLPPLRCNSAILYFFMSIMVLIITLICYVVASRMKYVTQRMEKVSKLKQITEVDATPEDMKDGEIVFQPISKLEIMKKTWRVMLGIFIIFVTTLSVFPALAVEMRSDKFLTKDGWYPLLLIALYNIGETMGRTLPHFPFFGSLAPSTAFATIGLRLILVPLCIVSVKPRWISHHAAHTTFIALLGLTHGYLAAIMVGFLPSLVNFHERDLALSMSVMMLMVGLAVGSVFGKIFTVLVDY